MGKVVATYLVRVTLREPDGLEEQLGPPPTVTQLEQGILELLDERRVWDLAPQLGSQWDVHVTAERTDL